MNRTAVSSAAILGALGVALGAFGTHTLRDILTPRALEIIETGVRSQMVHALALLILGVGGFRRSSTLLLIGTVLFSGSLYLLSMTGQTWLGALTPLGGVLQIAGWLVVLLELRQPTPDRAGVPGDAPHPRER